MRVLLVYSPFSLHSIIRYHFCYNLLRYIVIDEAHSYKGAFGCHTALIIRRLKRICSDGIYSWAKPFLFVNWLKTYMNYYLTSFTRSNQSPKDYSRIYYLTSLTRSLLRVLSFWGETFQFYESLAATNAVTHLIYEALGFLYLQFMAVILHSYFVQLPQQIHVSMLW